MRSPIANVCPSSTRCAVERLSLDEDEIGEEGRTALAAALAAPKDSPDSPKKRRSSLLGAPALERLAAKGIHVIPPPKVAPCGGASALGGGTEPAAPPGRDPAGAGTTKGRKKGRAAVAAVAAVAAGQTLKAKAGGSPKASPRPGSRGSVSPRGVV